jgi:tetratricopeptide (TPR) repeat protein
LARAVALANSGQGPAALQLCRQAIEQLGAQPGLLQLEASLLLAAGDASGALLAIAPVLARFVDHAPSRRLAAQARGLLARQASSNGQAALAAELLALVVAEPQAPAGAWCDYGQALHTLGLASQAGVAFERATTLAPDLLPAWFGLALACEDQGDLQAAAAALRRLLALQADHVQALVNLALIEQKFGHLDAALDLYARGWRLQPQDFGRIAMALSSQANGAIWLRTAELQDELALRAPPLDAP